MVLLRTIWGWSTLFLLLALWVEDLRAQAVENPSNPQVLFSFDRTQGESTAETNSTAEFEQPSIHPAPANTRIELEAKDSMTVELPPAPLPKAVPYNDPAVNPAAQIVEIPTENSTRDSRKLAPLSRKDFLSGDPNESQDRTGKLPFELPNISSLGTAGTGLVLVVGLFLVCVALVRRGGPSPTSPLPQDAVAVLGRIPLAPKQYAHLLQVGNKLVLVSISADRTDTITEVTEPAEVDRLLTLCMKGNKQGSSAEFQRMLQKMSKEPAKGFLGREAASAYTGSTRG